MFFNSFLLLAGLLPIQTDTLKAVVVTADKGVIVSRTDTLVINPAQTVSDVLNSNSSLFVSDNGGYAGLKTVSLRGLGSSHSSIYIDGIRVGNVQSGQADLGMFGLSSFSSVVVDYAQNSINFTSAKPSMRKRVSGEVAFQGGAWNSYLPLARLNVKLSENVVSSFSAGGVFSKGNYTYGEDKSVRENNDIKQGQFGADFWGTTQKGYWQTKAYFNVSERGVAGSVNDPSEDRQKDKNFFVQGRLTSRFTDIYELIASAKFAYDYMGYESSWGDNYYKQFEEQINTSHLFRFARWFTLSASLNTSFDNLCSDNYEAFRTNLNTVLTTTFHTEKLRVNLSVDYLGAFDKDGENRTAVMPSADLRIKLVEGFDFLTFGRRAYRIPTFNELYHVGFGNPNLKCEDAWLTEVGFEWNKGIDNWNLQAKADYFFNFLNNKITSAPTPEDPNIWAPYNIGKVKTNGLDISLKSKYTSDLWTFELGAKYTLQSSLDKTEDSYTHDQQIPYVAKHSFALNMNLGYSGWALNTIYNHKSGRQDSSGDLSAWNTLDISLSKTFSSKYTVFVTARNITNTRYEISSGYPMPGASVQGGFNIKF